jgi:prephenate dehydrogenase
VSTRTVLIAGLGLIGGSAGMALRRRGWTVRYLDPHVALDDAQRAGAADARAETLDSAELLLLATPVDIAIEQLRSVHSSGVVTSACSVMRPLRDAAPGGVTFISGHPLAGSHERGLGAARADLFEGKRWFVDGDDPFVDELVRDCGAVRERVGAAEHDAAVALTSHLPQILSTALAAHLQRQRGDLLRFAGTGLETFLRLAGSSAEVWQPVIDSNRDNLEPHADAVAEIVRNILRGDSASIFADAQQFRKTQ